MNKNAKGRTAKNPVLFRETSTNRKLGPVDLVENDSKRKRPIAKPPYVASTYLPIEQSCPGSCPLKAKRGNMRPCYADAGFTGFTVRALERAAKGRSALDLAILEALAIDQSFKGGKIPLGARATKTHRAVRRDLRLHISGDVQQAEGAAVLAGAAARWRQRGGGSVWTYTHAWRHVPRSSWGSISVLASVETIADAHEARARGYTPALLVERHPEGGRAYVREGLRVVPCPAETRTSTCTQCRLCLDRDLLKIGIAISFSAHGPLSHETAKRVVQLPLFKDRAA